MVLKNRYLYLILFIHTIVFATHINWQWDYEKALLLAKKQNKNLMVFLQKKDCIECKKMLQITLINQNYIDNINKNFISVIVTYEDKNDYPIELLYSLEFPSLFFIRSQDESYIIEPISGFIKPKQFNAFSSSIF